MVSIIILWDHRRICGSSLTETSLCGAYLYLSIKSMYLSNRLSNLLAARLLGHLSVRAPDGMHVQTRYFPVCIDTDIPVPVSVHTAC